MDLLGTLILLVILILLAITVHAVISVARPKPYGRIAGARKVAEPRPSFFEDSVVATGSEAANVDSLVKAA